VPLDNFTLYWVITQFPSPWPPSQLVSMLRTMQGNVRIEVVVHRDGHLEASAGSVDGPPDARMHFQRIAPEGDARASMILTSEEGRLRLRLNDRDLLPLSEAHGDTVVIASTRRTGGSLTPSYLRDDALDTCRAAMDERRRRFKQLRAAGSAEGRRMKSVSEQVAELVAAIRALDHLTSSVRHGHVYLAPTLANQLRGLIYWPNERRTWNPLLYRVADRAGLPLPVFGDIAPDDELPEVVLQAASHMRRLSASCIPRFPSDRLVDLQDFMQMTVARFRFEEVAEDQRATVQDVLGGAANTMGAAHYDETVELDIDRIHRTRAFDASVMHMILVNLGDVVAELGRHVVARVDEDHVSAR